MNRDRPPPKAAPSAASLDALFQRSRDAVLIADGGSGRIMRWNPAAEAMFGYTVDEALALTVDALVPVRLCDQLRDALGDAATSRGVAPHADGRIRTLMARRRSGDEFAAELSLSPVATEGAERHALAIIRDVSGRARAEAERDALAAEHARLIETSHMLQVAAAELASVRSADDLSQGMVDRAMHALGADGCAVWLFDAERVPRLDATRGLSDEFHRRLAAQHRRQIAAGTEAALAGAPVFERDVAAAVDAGDPKFAATLRTEGLVSGLRLPLREPGGRVAGWLTLYHRRERLYGEDEVRLAQAFADGIAVALRNARLTEQERAAREEAARRLEETAVLEERARLARDLHDSVTQSIFSVGMLARAAQTQHERGAAALGATLARVAQLAQEALAEMRALLVTLRPVALDEEGLDGALTKLTDSFQARSGIAIACHAETDARPAPEAETAIYRIVQEALANVAKHAGASEASVTLSERDGILSVTVADNGRGFDPAATPVASSDGRTGGIGLRSMRERAAAAGVGLRLRSAPGAGTTVTLTAPVVAPGHGA